MEYWKHPLVTLIPLIWCANSLAAPVEFDTKDAHVIVVRPVDAWSGDASVSEDTLDAIRDRKAAFSVVTTSVKTGKVIDVDGDRDHPVTTGVQNALSKQNIKFSYAGKSAFMVRDPIAVNPSEMAAVTQAQAEYFKQNVISQGDPETLPGKVGARKFFGGVLALGATVFAMDKFGAAIGSQATLGSGITDDIYRIAAKNRGALAPINLPNVDFTRYKTVDVRKVTGAADRLGQIIIAYKEDKTPEAEQEALIQAIVVTAGADTTVAEVEKSRAADLANRLVIWKSWCASNADEAKCKAE